MLRSIALLRGLSALFVVLFHSVHYEGRALHESSLAFEGVADRLSLCGITMFFCLSGYLMARLVEGDSFGRFVSRRILRIYPPFLMATAIAVIASRVGLVAIGDFPLVALTLLPVGEIIRPLGVEWTLVYEVLYYAIASLFCFGATRRFFPAFIMLWTAVVLVVFLGFDMFGSTFQPTLSEAAFSIWNLGFLAGALGRFAERKGWARPSWVFPGLLILAISELWGLGIRHLFLPIGLALIALAAISWEERRGGLHPPEWAIWIGDASYGIYLLHITVIRLILAHVAPEADLPTGLLSLIMFCAALLVATPFGLFEHRVYGWLVQRLPKRNPPQDRAADGQRFLRRSEG